MFTVLSRACQWPLLERVLHRLLGRFTTWPADEFARFTSTPIGGGPLSARQPVRVEAVPVALPAPTSLSPGAFEKRFNQLHADGRYGEMWAMLAEDAQRSWGSEERFVSQMRAGAAHLVDAEIGAVRIVPEWRDPAGRRTYHNVAQLAVRYRLKVDYREMTIDRQVHLVPAADGWRTLCYPQTAAG